MHARLFGMALLGLFLCASTAHGFELQRTKRGAAAHWDADAVDFVVDPSLAGMTYGAVDAARDAASAWSGRAGAPLVRVAVGTAPLAIGNDGRNVIAFAPDGYPAAHGALAISIVTFDDATGRIVDTDIVVNGAYRFAILPASARGEPTATIAADGEETTQSSSPQLVAAAATFDLVHVLAHEMGHCLGLGDSSNATAVMYRLTAPEDASRRDPTADDESGLHAAYAAHGRGCGASVSPTSPSSPDLFAFAPLVAALAWRRVARSFRRARDRARAEAR